MNYHLSKNFLNSLSLSDREFLIDLGIEGEIYYFYSNCVKRICSELDYNSTFAWKNLERICVTYMDKENVFFILSLIISGMFAIKEYSRCFDYASTEDES